MCAKKLREMENKTECRFFVVVSWGRQQPQGQRSGHKFAGSSPCTSWEHVGGGTTTPAEVPLSKALKVCDFCLNAVLCCQGTEQQQMNMSLAEVCTVQKCVFIFNSQVRPI